MAAKRMTGVALAIVAVLFAAACAPADEGRNGGGGQREAQKGPIAVGSKIDVEGPLLGHMIIAMLEQEGFRVEDRTRTGATDVVRRALTSGEIDIYPEYTANAILIFNRDADVEASVLRDPRRTYETAKRLDAENDVVWLGAAPANNTWGIAIPRSLAASEGIRTFRQWADYIKRGGRVKVAGSQEFFESEAAFPSFEEAYGFRLRDDQKVVLATGDTAVTERAAAEGTNDVNAAMAYGTDGTISALELQWLEDDRNAQPIYQPAPTVRKEVSDRYPELGSILDPVFERLDEETLQQLNGRIAVEGQDARSVARDWLRQEGFLD